MAIAEAAHEEIRVATLDDGTDLILCLRELRGELSYAELARRTGIRADELSKIENGKTTAISWKTLTRLLHELHIQPDELIKVRTPASADPITAGMLDAAQSGLISSEVAEVWSRGENRRYPAEDTGWEGTEHDAGVTPKHRRKGAGT